MRSAAVLALGLVALAGLGACSQGTPAGGGRDSVEITIHHSAFLPSVIEVEPGAARTFVVRNDDPIAHELIIGNEAVQLRHENGTERAHGAVPGEISIPANATRSTTYIFPKEGTLLFGCHLPAHYDYGMKGRVLIMEG